MIVEMTLSGKVEFLVSFGPRLLTDDLPLSFSHSPALMSLNLGHFRVFP